MPFALFSSLLGILTINMRVLTSFILAFFHESFSGGGKIYCYANFFCYAIFLLFLDQISGGGQVSEGGKLSQGVPPLPPVEESQYTEKHIFCCM